MNIDEETPGTSVKGIFADEPLSGGSSSEINRLSEQVEELKDKLGDVIFIAATIIIIVADLAFLPNSQTWAAPISILAVQIIFLYMMARVCRVNDINRLQETLLDGLDRWKGNPRPQPPTDQADR